MAEPRAPRYAGSDDPQPLKLGRTNHSGPAPDQGDSAQNGVEQASTLNTAFHRTAIAAEPPK